MKTKIIVILGPTAVGKTALSIELAKRFKGEVISGDSQQVYRGLDIGTAKVTETEQEGIPHHLLNVRDADQSYSAFDFVTEAKAAIADIHRRGRLPIIAGGTGLYIQSLLEGYHLGGQVPHEEILAYRAQLDTWSDEALFGKIAELGLDIPQINRRRAMRALEIAHLGGRLENSQPDYEALLICLDDERERLYERINQRVDHMLEAGLLEEARWLYDSYPDVQASRGIGYKEFFPYFAGQMSLEEAVARLKQNTRRFAKRQLTWFRNRMKAAFYQVGEPDCQEQIMQDIRRFLERERL
ncbi:tRNA (adenosine(37)-N6)-dimethylallyltransferase MiaA [Streptococcus panodentis]|uniref:tRNA dimethylallyltransferase n=1 Tax=Streptococcus panodentis TaxID=1581472 RepID=A0ABS5AZ77_9STRE|nr:MULTISPECIES: tRNA (adenosine(37)-N6)-dimethylallyltransferase MiaA [Streptococcus]KXT84079.1 tRNA delta(2)-isopentenylpyrophosphate transferase [Streptococcus sp. DD11]MBP2621887.1 tRNA (adenosine(37)-N6)-dimethylallyltransferase MiaA [Streptococcus panodentis]